MIPVKIVIVAFWAFGLTLLFSFPPWIERVRGVAIRKGHSFLLSPPSFYAEPAMTIPLVLAFILTIIAAGCWYFLKNKNIPMTRSLIPSIKKERIILVVVIIAVVLANGFIHAVFRSHKYPARNPQESGFDRPLVSSIEPNPDVTNHQPPENKNQDITTTPARSRIPAWSIFAERERRLRANASRSPDTLVQWGNLHLARNNTQEALEDFHTALYLCQMKDPTPPVVFTNVGNDAVNLIKSGKFGTVLLVP